MVNHRTHNRAAILALTITLTASTAFPAWAADDRRVVQTAPGSIVTNSFGNCARTQWEANGDPCAPPAPAPAPAPIPVARPTIEQEARTIYFDFNQTTLTPQARAKLDSLAAVLKSESDVKQAHIVGYADRIGSESYNQNLSRKRSEVVAQYLIAHGFVNASVAETRWLGDTVPVTSCPSNLAHGELINCLQKDRRVEVELEYLPQ